MSELSLVVTALIYGRSGTGKTTLSGTYPKPLLVLDIGEKGTDSLANVDGVKVLKVQDWDDFEDIYWELKDSDHGFKTVNIDALHSLQALAINKAKLNSNKTENDQTSQRDFGQASGLLNQWIFNYRDLRDIGINVNFLAHDKITETDTDDEDGAIAPEIGPRLMPSVASAVCGAVNLIGHTFIREETVKSKKIGQKAERKIEYCLRIGANPFYTTKIRKPKEFEVPEYIVDPTYDKLVNIIKGSSSKPKATKSSPNKKRRLTKK